MERIRSARSAAGRGVWLRFGVLVVLLVVAAIAAWRAGVPSTDAIRAVVAGSGAVGVLAFVAIYVACTLLVLPKAVLSITAGIAFGFLPGVVVVLVAATAGACAAFVVGRWLGRDAVERMAGPHLARLDALVARYGFSAIVLMRLVPLIPFTVINYATGLTSVGFRSYAAATAIGIVPGTVAYVALGAFGASPTSPAFIAAVIALAVLTVGGMLIARRRGARERRAVTERDGVTL